MTAWNWDDLRRSTVTFEDDAILVLNKPAGVSVMGERHDVDLVELADAAGERLYPVHRIDKVTSGAVLLAKSLPIHSGLTRQFTKRTVDKTYLVITATTGLPDRGVIDLPLSQGRKGRVRIAAPRGSIRVAAAEPATRWWVADEDLLDTRRYPSTTRFRTVWHDDGYSVLAVAPLTGRRHQIRVHLAWIGHPIVGDPLFDRGSDRRTCLHSWRLAVDAGWLADRRLCLAADPGPDFWAPLADRLPAPAVADLLHRVGHDDPAGRG